MDNSTAAEASTSQIKDGDISWLLVIILDVDFMLLTHSLGFKCARDVNDSRIGLLLQRFGKT